MATRDFHCGGCHVSAAELCDFHYCCCSVHHVGIVALDSALSDGDLQKNRE